MLDILWQWTTHEMDIEVFASDTTQIGDVTSGTFAIGSALGVAT